MQDWHGSVARECVVTQPRPPPRTAHTHSTHTLAHVLVGRLSFNLSNVIARPRTPFVWAPLFFTFTLTFTLAFRSLTSLALALVFVFFFFLGSDSEIIA